MTWILWLFLSFVSPAHAQCNGSFSANTVCGNNSAVAAPPGQVSFGGLAGPVNIITPTTSAALPAITTDGSVLNVQNQNTISASTILTATNAGTFRDVTRSVGFLPSGSTVVGLNGYGSYIATNTSAFACTQGTCGVGDLFFGNAIANAPGAQVWGVGLAFNDNVSGACNVAAMPCLLNGIELDYTVTGTHTNVQGVTLLLNSTHAVSGNALQVGLVSGGTAQWVNALVSNDGCCTQAAVIGASAASGISVASQPIIFNRFDSGGVEHGDTLQDASNGILTFGSGGAIAQLNLSSVWLQSQFFQNGFFVTQNLGGSFPSTGQALFLGWNFSSGAGESDFFNTYTLAVTDSFRWYQQTGASAATLLMRLTPTGSLSVTGVINGASLNVTGAVSTFGLTTSGSILVSQATSLPTLGATQGSIGADPSAGLEVSGNGATFDIVFNNSSNSTAFAILHNATTVQFQGILTFTGDTGISRDSAAVIDFGNGTATNSSATLRMSSFTIGGTPSWDNFSTGAGTQTFTNSPCSALTTERWIKVKFTGSTSTFFVPACS